MKHINLLPESTWLKRHQWLLAISVLLISVTVMGAYFLRAYLGLSVNPSTVEVSNQYSIYQLKMVGYLSQGQMPYAKQLSLLAFPNGEILTVEVEDVVGAEAAKVVDIQPTMTTLSLANKTHVLYSGDGT